MAYKVSYMTKEETKKYEQEYYKKNAEKRKAYSKQWRRNNKERKNEYQKAWREKKKQYMVDWQRNFRAKNKKICEEYRKRSLLKAKTERPIEFIARRLFFGSKSRAKAKKMAFDLTQEWIVEKIKSGKCSVTNIPFYINPIKDDNKSGPVSAFAPSLDRINTNRGYTKKNTQVVIWIYNSAKSSFTHNEVMVLAEALNKTNSANNKEGINK